MVIYSITDTIRGPLPTINKASKLLNSLYDGHWYYFLYLTYTETELLAHVTTANEWFKPSHSNLDHFRYHAMWMRWWGPLVALTYECVMVKSVFTSGFQSPTFSLAATILPREGLFSWSWFACSMHMFFFHFLMVSVLWLGGLQEAAILLM